MPRCWFSCGSRKDKEHDTATRNEKPGASSNGSSERQQAGKNDREGRPATKQPEAAVDGTSELTTSQILWNEAYDSLKVEEAALVKSYVRVMAKTLQPEGTGTADGVLAEMDDPVERQLAMEKLVRDGVQKIARTSAVATGVGIVADGFLKAKGLIDTAIGNIPQAALPWAGVCVVLQILINPMQASQANQVGMEYVVANMDWYCSLSEHILSKEYIKVGEENYEGVWDQLNSTLVKLYKALLLYQMKSVCSYYRNQVEEFLRQMLNLQDWDEALEDVKKAETVAKDYLKQFTTLQMRDMTGKIVKDGEERNELLGGMRQDIRQQNDDQKKMHLDDETAKCLRDFDAVDPQSEMDDIEARKDTLLREAYEWVLRTEQYAAWINWDVQDPCRLLWINGPAGTGKTMLLIGIIRELEEQLGANLTYFFCQSASQNLKDATSALRSLILLLLQRQPQLTSHLLAKYRSGSRFNDSQAFWTLKRVFLEMLADESFSPVYLIVDALDECEEGTPGREHLIELMSESLRATDKVRWLVSSRPEVHVYEKLKERDAPGTIRALDVRSKDAVNAYIDHHLSKLAKRPGYTPKIQEEISREIRQRAMNTFLWVALVFKELQNTPGLYAMRKIKKCPNDLLTLYDHLMNQVERGQDEDPMYCRSVLAAVCLAYRPLSFDELHVIAGLDPDDIPGRIVKECGSLLTVQDNTVSLVHLSAREWLMSNFEARLQKRGPAQVHADICQRSIAGMSAEESGLKRNICGIEEGTQSDDIVIPYPDPLAALRYSCEFWADHLLEVGQISDENCQLFADDGEIFSFLKSSSSKGVKFASVLKDAENFVRRHRTTIEQYPLQTYGTALALSPTRSDVRNMFWKERLSFIESVQGVGDAWNACLQAFEPPTFRLPSVAFSPDEKVLVLATSGRLQLWDLATGGCKRVLEEGDEDHEVYAVAFSPDGNTLTTVAQSAVRFWDVTTEACKMTLDFPDGSISAAAFSLDGACLAVASGRTVGLWDTAGMVCDKTLEDVADYSLTSIALSPDGKLLAACTDREVQVWDIAAGAVKQQLPKSPEHIHSAAFSPDSKTLALCSWKQTAIWDVESAIFSHELNEDYFNPFNGFTADGRFVALNSFGKVQFWDAADPICKQILQGRLRGVRSISRSPNANYLASVEPTMSVRLWDGSICEAEQTSPGLSASVSFLSSSPDDTVLVCVAGGTMQLWTTDGVCTHTLTHPTGSAGSVTFSPDGKTFVSIAGDDTACVWDVETGRLLHTLKHCVGECIKMVVFSPDGTTLAGGSVNTLQLWDPVTGSSKNSFEGFSIHDACFSPDGKFLAASSSRMIFLLNIATDVQQTLDSPHQDDILEAAFSPDNKILASSSVDGMLCLWDTATGTCTYTFELEGEAMCALSFSDDGKFLLTNLGRLNLEDGSVSPQLPASEEGLASPPVSSDRQRAVKDAYAWPVIDGLRYDGEWVIREEKSLLYIPAGQRPAHPWHTWKMFKNILFIGDGSGQVTCYKFSFPSS
ncbi:vegetative incompatibility protein HET-E-1 [Aspergillus lentulus]|nr:vegetative incompatibility protein HET-E-1 [Aspergillus lentulus]